MSSLRLIIALHTAAEDLLNEPDLVGSPAWFPTMPIMFIESGAPG